MAQNATGYAVLLADSDGVVMETLGEPGQVVSAGQAVIRLARAGQREALVQLPETLRPAIGSEAQATRYGNETEPVIAGLRLLSDSADTATRTFEARYVLEGPLANAPLGSTVTLQIQKNSGERPVMQVPLASLYDSGKGPGIWRISTAPTKVVWQPVTVLSVGAEAVQVTGDVRPGEKIVALGAHLLHEGEAVRLAEQRDAAHAGANHERKTLQSVRAGGARALDHPVLIILITIAGIYSFWPWTSGRSALYGQADDHYQRLARGDRAGNPDQVAEPLEKRLQELKWYDRTETYTRPGMAFITLSLQDSTPPSQVQEEFYQARKAGDEAKISPPA